MKKSNPAYVLKWRGGALLLVLVLLAAGYALQNAILYGAALLVCVLALVFVPKILHKQMEKSALELEKSFPEKNFTYQQKFTAHDGVFYIDVSGRIAVVWRDNPTELYFVDASKITDIHTNNGQQLRGTSLVSCQFCLEGKKIKIYTLRVSNGQLPMKDKRVVDAIAKADKLCELLNAAKNSAVSGTQNRP